MYEKEWLPQALSIGISYDDFWKMNPRIIRIHVDGYSLAVKNEMERQNAFAHLQGHYFLEALLASVGNMFGGKSAKKFEYPKDPYGTTHNSEKEKQQQIENLFASLEIMQRNFELNHKNDSEDGTV